MTDARSLDELQQAAHRHWRQVALSTRPIDKGRAAAAVDAVYTAATGRPPACILFFDSPLQAEIATTFFNGHYPQEPLRWQRRPQVTRMVEENVGVRPLGAMPSAAEADYARWLENPVRAALDAVYNAGPDPSPLKHAFRALCSQLSPLARDILVRPRARHKGWQRRADIAARRSVSLRRWIGLAAYHGLRRAAGLDPHGDETLISAVTDVCEQCGWCWFFPDIAIVSDRPALLRLDESGRLHAEDGPALRYRDGFALHALRGVRVARWIVERPDKIAVADVESEQNAEVRRVLIERMGYRRYLSLSGAVAVSRDETGILWHRQLPSRSWERRAWSFVEVVNGTPEPDGSHRHYFLRVPPGLTSARTAVAWTYGLGGSDYQPLIRT
jgi:uncharacterized protein DUF6745